MITDLHALSKAKTEKRETIPHGSFISVCKDIQNPIGIKLGKALDFYYDLISANGDKYELRERYYIGTAINSRTREFFDYLVKNGIKNFEDFIGVAENVLVGYDISGGRKFKSIIEREFAGETPEAGENVES